MTVVVSDQPQPSAGKELTNGCHWIGNGGCRILDGYQAHELDDLAASSSPAAPVLLEPPLRSSTRRKVEPFDAAWNNFRLVTGLSGVLLIVFASSAAYWGTCRTPSYMDDRLVGFIVCNLLIMAFRAGVASFSLLPSVRCLRLSFWLPSTLPFQIATGRWPLPSLSASTPSPCSLPGSRASSCQRDSVGAAYVLPILAAIASASGCTALCPRAPEASGARNVRLQRLDARGSRHGLG